MKHGDTGTRQGAGSVRCAGAPRAQRGFSLAEVLIALAITSFALLALIGVLPEGLKSLRTAQRNEAEARIVQQLAAAWQMKTWSELDSLVGRREESTYDGNGAWVDAASTDVVYRTRAELLAGLPLPNETGASPYLRRLRIRISNQPRNGASLDAQGSYRERYVTLVDYDKSPPQEQAAAPAPSSGGSSANP
ncbi:MAG: Verru_Chthon cassette protein B [Verrucomicrobiaceae bacterium]|nr:Verru_Chthon cassette protein B [Verrucomicrobiaceae bacterium]